MQGIYLEEGDKGGKESNKECVTKSVTTLSAWSLIISLIGNSKLFFSGSVVSDSLWPHGLQHTRLPCPLLSPQVYSNSCPLRQWCHPTISSSVIPFSSCLQSAPASGSFPMNQLFASGGQNIGASASILPMNIQDWFPWGWTGWISLQSKGLLQHNTTQESSPTQLESVNSLALSPLYGPTLTSMHDYWKNHSLD